MNAQKRRMAVFIGANRSNILSALLSLECYFLTVNCVAANSPWQQKTTTYADNTERSLDLCNLWLNLAASCR